MNIDINNTKFKNIGSTFFVGTRVLQESKYNREIKVYGLYDKGKEMGRLFTVKYHDSDYIGVPLELAKDVLKRRFMSLIVPNTHVTYIPH